MTQTDRTLFISDLHLSDSRPDLVQALEDFIATTARGAESLYILGDLFNVWVGDDYRDESTVRVSKSLTSLADSGTGIFIMHGNRDFLMGAEFARQCQATLIPDPYVIKIEKQKILLMHGDTLCTRDLEYMEFRKMVRNKDWQQGFLDKPLSERQAFADQARQQSKSMSSNKAEDIMDVTPDAVANVMQEYEVELLIHGHTHRPDEHLVNLNKPAKRIVLGDWDKFGWYLEWSDNALALRKFSI